MKILRLTHGIGLILFTTFLQGQTDSLNININTNKAIHQNDPEVKDVLDLLRKKGKTFDKADSNNIRKKPRFTVVPFVGYTLQTRLAAIVAGNVAFYSDQNALTNQSAISISMSYSQNNQIILPILSNIWTKRNKFNLLGNWRFYKYPEQTFGLGGNSKTGNKVKIDYNYFLFREAVLKKLHRSAYYAGIGYNLSYHTQIKQITSTSGAITDFDRYGRTASSISSGISGHFIFDNRGNTINPPKGSYVNFTGYAYSKILGSNDDWQSLILDMRKYISVGRAKNVFAVWSYAWFTYGGKVPYLDLPSTGWDAYSNTGRGYIQSRFKGKNLLYLEAEYRFRITKNGILGGVLFGNAQSVSDWPGNKFTVISPAGGAGLRIKLNKHSGTNLAIDYGIGMNGSGGLFLNVGEVF